MDLRRPDKTTRSLRKRAGFESLWRCQPRQHPVTFQGTPGAQSLGEEDGDSGRLSAFPAKDGGSAPSLGSRAGPIGILLVEDNEDGVVGGSHACLWNLVTRFDPATVRSVTLFYQNNPIARALTARGFETHVWELERAREQAPPPGPMRRLLQGSRLAGAIWRRVQFLKAHRIDVVHLNNSAGRGFHDWLVAAKLLGMPCLTHVRGFFPVQERSAWRYLQRSFDHYIAVSHTMEKFLQSQGFPQGRISVIYDTVEEAELRSRLRRTPPDVRGELQVGADQLLVTMVGHIRDWKGQDVLVRALAGMPPLLGGRLVVAFVGGVGRGSEQYHHSLLRLVEENNLHDRVRFLGERADAADLMAAADIVVHASTRPEPFGLVVLEGMLLGRPMIASSLGGPAEIIRDGDGLLFDPSDPANLTSALIRLSEDEAERQRLGEAGQRRARAFGTVEKTVRQTEALYRSLTGR